MARGDHIYVVRGGLYAHHGLDIGEGFAIHWSSADGSKRSAAVRRTTIGDFANDGIVCVRRYGMRDSADDAVARAESMLGRAGYDLVFDNCEHFATWCATGVHSSEQVETAVSGIGVTCVGVGAPSLGLRVITTLGDGAAGSAPNLTSGLARAGGSMYEGLALIAGGTGALALCGMCFLLRDKPSLPDAERKARKAGRYGAAGGAVAGTLVTLTAVEALGVAGVSAAGLTSGLAMIGGAFDGGMRAGITAAIAFPALLAIALGYLVYRLARAWVN
jgi:hypothetical protein